MAPAIATFVVVLAMTSGAYWLFVLRPERQTEKTLSRRLRKLRGVKAAQASRLAKDVKALSSVGSLDAALKNTGRQSAWFQTLVEQSGSNTTVGKLLLVCSCLGLLAFVLVQVVVNYVIAAAAAGMAASYIPIGILKFKRTLRFRKFEEQFPEALDLLARALRAGHSFSTGLEMIAEEMPKPSGPEFKLIYDQQNYGLSMVDALNQFAERVPLLDARFFVTAVLIQRESGGNLSEVLDNLAGVMRDRFKVKRQMRVISAHGRITGWVLTGLPPVLGSALMIVNPEHRELMFGDPLGHQMLMGAVVLQIIGALAIRKIVNVEY